MISSSVNPIVSFLRSKGLSGVAIAGILGNIQIESSGRPTAYNPGEGAIGLAQWEGGRRSALQNFAAQHHGHETDLNIQLQFMWHELTTSFPGALQSIMHAKTAAQAAAAWDSQYEISAGTTRQARINAANAYYQGGLHNVAGSGGSAFAATSLAAAPAATTRADLGGVDSLGHLLNRVPELRGLVQSALKGNWTTDKFQNAVENSKWWKQHSETARSLIIQKANDPASFQLSLTNTMHKVTSLAQQLGFRINGSIAEQIASSALLTGNDTDQQWLTAQLGHHQNYSHLYSEAGLSGGMASTVQQLNQLAGDYGFSYSPAGAASAAVNILEGAGTLDTYKERLIAQAKSLFPGLAAQINGGTTVRQLADPYVQSMSNLLEVNPDTISLNTPAIRKALQGSVPHGQTGAPVATPLWQFEQQVRQDPRWQYTNNAKDSMSSALVKVGQDFGFGGF